jgi:hypothetical protein
MGFGAGEQVADGQWTSAHEFSSSPPRRRRTQELHSHARLATILSGRQQALVCEDLVLRARLDVDQGRPREAALQLLIALDTALAELPGDPAGAGLDERVAELRAKREAVTGAAQGALAGPPSAAELEVVAFTLGRLEAALRARAAAGR